MCNTIQISIIIPTYNSQKYIGRCLDSILKQTYKNFEIIIINDGSTDNTLEICNQYLTKHPKTQIISKENEGVSTARNEGLKRARGEWICFIDSDDYILPYYLESLLNSQSPKTDLIWGGWQYGNKKKEKVHICFFKEKYEHENIRQVFFETNIIKFGFPWGKLFKKEVIKKNDITFNSRLKLSEDRLFLYQYLQKTEGIAFSTSANYVYSIGDGLSSKKYDYNNELFRYEILEKEAYKIKVLYDLDDIKYLPFFCHHLSYIIRMVQTCEKNSLEKYYFIKSIYQSFFKVEYFNLLKKRKNNSEIYKELGLYGFLFANKYFFTLYVYMVLKYYGNKYKRSLISK